MARALTIADVAGELGRSSDWLYANWRELVADKKLPEPVMGRNGGALAWNAAQVYAFLDRGLPAALRANAAAYRAAEDAARQARPEMAAHDLTLADAETRLDRRFDHRS